MATELKARFSIIDEMSAKLESMVELGDRFIGAWERAQNVMSAAIDNAVSGASNVISSLTNATDSLNGINSAADNALSGTNDFSDSVSTLEDSINGATQTTEQFAEAGIKVADALSAESDILSMCEQVTGMLSSEMGNATNINNELSGSFEQASQAMREYANSGQISSEVQKELENASRTAESALEEFSNSMNGIDYAAGKAVSATDNWTAAVKFYDKSALEAVYSTEELVGMGYKTVDAMFNEESSITGVIKAADSLNSTLENSISTHTDLMNTFEQSSAAIKEYADSGKMSTDMLEKLSSTSNIAEQALDDLENAANQAKDAENNLNTAINKYIESVQAGTPDVAILETAQNQAAQAAENLSTAEDNAKKAVKDLSKASDEAGKSVDENCKKGVDAFEALADTVIAAKIADTVLNAAKAAYELADAFSEAEKVVVNATGATCEALKGLEESMMSAYASHSQDINTTAGAIGEINTRMALTGEKLTDVTGKFLDYSRITGSDVVGSVQNVTKVMNQWGVDMDNVESVLDRLAYAGQISGASVDNLSSTLITGAASFQEVGLSLDNTIQLLSDFELAGINSTTAVTAMRTAVNNFSKDGLDSKTALQSTITEIANMGNASEATAKAVEVFGSRAGQQLAAAIRNGTVSVESFTTTLESADGTLAKTAAASETLSEKWTTVGNKMKTTFTSVLQPSIDKFSSGLAGIVGNIGEFLDDYPIITGAITALGVGLGAAALSVAGVGISAAKAAIEVTAFGTALKAALGPIGLITAGATVAAGVVMLLTNAFSSTENKVEDYNGSLQQCAEEISRTETTYRNVCNMYGESSKAAEHLKAELDTLHTQYEKGGGFIADYAQRLEESKQKLADFQTDYSNKMTEIDNTWQNGMIAAAQLDALSQKTQLTNTDLDLMSKYADYLNDTFNCNIEVNYNTGELTGFDPTNINSIMAKVAEENRKQAAIDSVTGADFTNGYIDALEDLKNIKDEYEFVKAEISKTWSDPSYVNTTGFSEREADKEFSKRISEAENNIEKYKSFIQNAYDDMGIPEQAKEYINMLENMANGFDNLGESAEKANEAMTPQEIAATVYSEYQQEIEELAQAYDEARESIRGSLDSMFSLFENAPNLSLAENLKDALSMDDATANIQSQIDYFNQYKEAAEQLSNLGIDNDIISQLDPEQAVTFANELSNMDSATAAAKVGELNEAFGELSKVKDETSNSIADIQEEYSKKMAEINDNMKTDVENLAKTMEFPDSAKTSAKNTLDAYIKQINESGDSAVKAAQDIANRISAALASANTKISISSSGTVYGPQQYIQANATGTTNSDDVFIAGENGPELIVGKQGSTVFPTSETNKIISAVSDLDGTNYSTNNSYVTAENSTEYSTFNSNQNTEIVNNYNSVQGSSYDDTRIVSLLERIDNTFSAIGNKIGNADTSYFMPETNSAEPVEVIVDLSLLDNLISKISQGEEISNYSDSISYGDTHNVDNSRNYNADYGDTISNLNSSVVEYGDTIKNFSESISNSSFIKNYESSENSFDNIRNYENINGDSFNRYSENAVNYGDTISNSTEIISSINSSRQLERNVIYEDNISRYSNTYKADYSRHSDISTDYGDIIKNVDNYISSSDYANTSESTVNYGDTISNSATSHSSEINNYDYKNAYDYDNMAKNNSQYIYNNLSETGGIYTNDNSKEYTSALTVSTANNAVENHGSTLNNPQSYSDSVVSIITPLPISNNPDIIERLVDDSQNLSDTYYNLIENNSVQSEVFSSDSEFKIQDNSDRTIAEKDSGYYRSENSEYSETVSKKEITININGEGEIPITVHGGMSKDEILEMLIEYMKPVLANVISEEMLEEGDSSYDY